MSDQANRNAIGILLDEDPKDIPEVAFESKPIDDTTIASELWIHAMLIGLLEPDAKRERRVQAVLARFEDRVVHLPESRTIRWRRISSFAVVAVLLLGIGFWFVSMPLSAEAAVNRVILSIQKPVTRVYSVRIHTRRFGPESIRDCRLYSHGTDKMAAVFADAIRSPAVIGFDGQHRWMVAGRSVWTSDADGSIDSEPFRERLIEMVTLGTIELNALLTKIPKLYEVKLLPTETLPGEEKITCRPIEATLLAPNSRLPQRIVIWSHPDTGVVRQMEVYPSEGRVRGPSRLEFILDGEQSVPDAFFTPEYHRIDR